MKKRIPMTLTALALGTALLAGCAAQGDGAASDSAATVVFSGDLSPESVLADNADYTTVNDDEWSEADAVDVTLSGSSATSDSDAVEIEGSTVTITEAGVYRLSGDLDGRVVVAAPDDALVVLLLDGADISTSNGSAIEVQSADDVAINLAAGSRNSVSDASSYADDADANAAIYSDADLTISGTGLLTVQGNGNDGITSKDDLVILSGDITVTAADDALRGKDSLVVEGGTLDLTATGGDGLKIDQEDDETQGYILVTGGSIDIKAGDDGLQAQTDTVVTGGKITASVADDGVKGEVIVSVGGGEITVTESTEAMEAANIGIFDGVIDLTSSDDGINASGNDDLAAAASGSDDSAAASGNDAEENTDARPGGGDMGGEMGGGMSDSGERLEISGGMLTVDAEGDGLDSNGSLTISGGDTVVYGPTRQGNGGIDANGDIAITGGTLVSLSAGGMEPAPGDDGQGWLIASAQLDAGQEVAILNENGDTVANFTSRKAATGVTYSSPDIESGASYTLVSGSTELATVTAGEGGSEGMGGPGGGQSMDGGAPDGQGGGPGGQMPDGQTPPDGQTGGGTPPSGAPGNPS